jgi:ADP-ribose pyrophosphatase YjhB (NUDIX family)
MDAPTGTDPTPLTFNRAAAVCIFYNGTICLGKRTLKCQLTGEPISFAGYWSPFGGTVEEGENPMVAAVRELEEETGIKIKISDLTYMCELDNDDSFTYILYAYHVSELLFPKLNFEHTESGYFTVPSLIHSPTPMCPHLVDAIFSYEKRRWKED